MKAMFMERLSIFEFFSNDGALILHLNVITLQVIVTRLPRVNATIVEHAKA